jgi:integrase
MSHVKNTGIYLRGMTWWLRYRGPRPDGSWGVIRESSGSSDPRVASKMRDDRVREAKNDRDGIRKFVASRKVIGLLLKNLEAHYETCRLKSLRQVKVRLAPVREFFAFKRASAVTRSSVAAYVAKRRDEDAADTTIDRETELLRRAFALAAKDERPLVAWVPKIARLVKANANARQGFVERADFEKVVAELRAGVLKDFAQWGYYTGMRLGEVRALTWEGYDKETRTIRLAAKEKKTGRARMIPLVGLPELVAVMNRRLADRRPGCPLIFHRDGKRVGDFYTTWMRACDRAKVRAFSFHDLRRTAVRNMVRAGIPERVAMDISGHRTRAVFDRYNIVSENDLAEALAKRGRYESSLPSIGAGTTAPRISRLESRTMHAGKLVEHTLKRHHGSLPAGSR